MLCFPAVAWCGGGGLREPWGMTGAGGGKAMRRGGKGGGAGSGAAGEGPDSISGRMGMRARAEP